MEDLKDCVLAKSFELYNAFLEKEMSKKEYSSPYKAAGIAYVKFAIEEKNLFSFLFMRDRSKEKTHVEESSFSDMVSIIMKNTKMNAEEAYDFHLSMWVVVHGLATMCATNYVKLEMPVIDKIVTKTFQSLMKNGESNENC